MLNDSKIMTRISVGRTTMVTSMRAKEVCPWVYVQSPPVTTAVNVRLTHGSRDDRMSKKYRHWKYRMYDHLRYYSYVSNPMSLLGMR